MSIKSIVKDAEHAAEEMIEEIQEATDDLLVPKHNSEIADEVKERVGEMIEEIEEATDVLIGGEKPKK